MEPGPAVASTLEEARERGFVGRRAELDAIDASLDGASTTRVHLVHGPGGIGKTTLLAAVARRGRRRGLSVVSLDAREIEPTADAVLDAIRGRRRHPGGPAGSVDLLLVDGYELLAGLDGWFRERLLPSRPATAVTVLAGRTAPGPGWRDDLGWRELSRVHELGPLDWADGQDLLRRRGVAAGTSQALARLGRGHPLALAMLADAHADAPAIGELADLPAVVAALCARIVDDVPDEAHRTGLATCAHATRMTQDLLRRTVGARAGAVWAWLESRPYVQRGEVGLFLHDLVRELFETEMGQRSPDAYAALHVTVRDYFLERLADPGEPRPDRAAAEILLLHRRGPLADHTSALRDAGLLSVSRAGAEDRAGIRELVQSEEGARSAALLERYAVAQPRGFFRVRSDRGVEAFAVQVYLPAQDDLDRDDPVAAAILAAVAAEGPLRPGERINVNRFAGASGRYQGDPMLLLVNGVSCILEWAHEPAAWTFVVTVDDARYGPYFEYLGMRRMVQVDLDRICCVGYGWDRRRFPVGLLFELMARRELTGETGPPPADLLRPAPLSPAAFAQAVRAALAALAFPERLAGSPLAATALVDPARPAGAAGLASTLKAAIAGLADEPGGAEHRRVLDRTYLHGAPSQEAAAQMLGLPFSTYRRHLARAHDRLTEVLWAVEVGTRAPPGGQQVGPGGQVGRR